MELSFRTDGDQSKTGGDDGRQGAEQDRRHLHQRLGQGIAVADGIFGHREQGREGRLADHGKEAQRNNDEGQRGKRRTGKPFMSGKGWHQALRAMSCISIRSPIPALSA